MGAEYRDQEGDFDTDILTRATPPLFLTCQLAGETCTGNSFAKYNVKEVYAELFVPILKDVPGAQALNVSAGIRRSDYSKETIGTSTNAQFKLEYRPITDLLLRATYAEVFRAPTIVDLSLAPTQDAPTFTDPCTNLTSAQLAAESESTTSPAWVWSRIPNSRSLRARSPASSREAPISSRRRATSSTFGFVYDSSYVRGLSLNRGLLAVQAGRPHHAARSELRRRISAWARALPSSAI